MVQRYGYSLWIARSSFFLLTALLLVSASREENPNDSSKEEKEESQQEKFQSGTSTQNTFLDNHQRQPEMYLCNPPPNTFSPEFLGHSEQSCGNKDVYSLKFGPTLDMCSYLYKHIHGKAPLYSILTLTSGDTAMVFVEEDFIQLCLPLFRRYNQCEERMFSTLCMDEQVLFIHSHGCQKPSEEDTFFTVLIASALVDDDEECFHNFCDGSMRVIDSSVRGLSLRLMMLSRLGVHSESCAHHFFSYSNLNYTNRTFLWTTNVHFPCCYFLYTVMWIDNPDEHGLNGNWQFLPFSCKVGEILLVVGVAIIGISGVMGNLLVVTVLLRSQYRQVESNVLRTSLALADLLTCLFVVVPSFFDHLSIMTGHTKDGALLDPSLDVNRTLEVFVLQPVHHGYRLFQAFVLNVSLEVSLFTVFLLSYERYIMAGRALKYRSYISVPRVLSITVAIWLIATLDSIIILYIGNGKFGAAWSTVNKISFGYIYSGNSEEFVHVWQSYGRLIILTIMCVFTLLFSISALVNFVKGQVKVKKEWQNLNMRVSGPFQAENLHIIITMSIITILFVVSVAPIALNIAFNAFGYDFEKWDLFTYASWWLLLASSAWNPWVYNIRSRQFNKDMREVMCQMLPACLRNSQCKLRHKIN